MRAAVGTIYVATASVGVVALVVSRVDRTSAYLLAGLAIALGVLAALALGQVVVYDDERPPAGGSARGTRG